MSSSAGSVSLAIATPRKANNSTKLNTIVRNTFFFTRKTFLFIFLLLSIMVLGFVAKITVGTSSNLAQSHHEVTILTAAIAAILFLIILCTMVLFNFLGTS